MFLFLSAILFIVLAVILVFVPSPTKYFKTKEGKGVLFGIGAVVLLSLALVLIFPNKAQAEEYKYLSSAELFVGLDNTRKISPMCDVGENSDKLTSNVGLKASIISTAASSVNVKYTHHSCAVNPDNKSYDALGVEVTYKLW
jgi:hypothetical protein